MSNGAPKTVDKPRGNFITQAWMVILLALFYGAALAGVQISLGGRIAQNKQDETYDMIPRLVEGADQQQTESLTLADAQGKERRVYKALAADGSHRGWVIPAGGQGFADRIEVLVGVDPAVESITGLYVLEQKETPGLGDYITDGERFLNQFEGQPAIEPLEVVKRDPDQPGEIRALSGATVSSVAVSGIVNEALAALRKPLRQAGGE